ncbi:hypothetical protein K440DRAFT_604422, partial [Wilcoxina mikolae CBS 423.85]
MESSTESPKTSIKVLYRKCIESFGNLTQRLNSDNSDHVLSAYIPLPTIQDELGRFRVWAGNVGADRTGRVSLDYRLREASQIHDKVRELLLDLDQKLHEVVSIVPGQEHTTGFSNQSDFESSTALLERILPARETDYENDVKIELECLTTDITEIVTNLYRLSVIIRHPAPRDRTQKFAAIDVSHFELFDIRHVQEKFPEAPEYLVRRLGRANTKRRQILTYYEKHHEKIFKYIDVNVPEFPVAMPKQQDSVRVVDPVNIGYSREDTKTDMTETTPATYCQPAPDIVEVASEAGQSETSYATSISSSSSSRHEFSVPLPPNSKFAFEGYPFKCPYCFQMIEVHDNRSWKKHLFEDLQPYVCTFEDCPKPDRMFDSRAEWFEHELHLHRREWFCNVCNVIFSTAALAEMHLREKHDDLFVKAQVLAAVDRCQRAITTDQGCPLCGEAHPPSRIRSHLARHLQVLALLALPRLIGVDLENVEFIAVDAQRPRVDNASLTKFEDPMLRPSQRSEDTELNMETNFPDAHEDITALHSTKSTFPLTVDEIPDCLRKARNSLHDATEVVHDHTRRFITESKLKEVVNDRLLMTLFREYECKWAQGVDVNEILRHYLKVLSILIWIGWDKWDKFDEYFLSQTRGVIVDKERCDKALPFNWDDTRASFLKDDHFGERFNREQYMFLPIIITEGEIVECKMHSRLPFLEADTRLVSMIATADKSQLQKGTVNKSLPRVLGKGAFGVVRKELVAPGHFQRSGNSNWKEQVIAVKHISDSGSYEGESINLKKLRQCLTEHKRLMIHLGGVTIGRNFYLFYDAADMDLQMFLTGRYMPFKHESFRSQCYDAIYQASGLASGLKTLHEFSLGGREVACYHLDLKPDNILIKDWHPTDSPVGTWMISDFGLSTIREVGESTEVGGDEEDMEVNVVIGPLSLAAVVDRRLQLSRAVTAKREGSTFGPPESKVSRRSDVWSFGCILSVVLTYILGGIDLVELFDYFRSRDDDDNECNDYFYRPKINDTGYV